jgi:hypothetical protein
MKTIKALFWLAAPALVVPCEARVFEYDRYKLFELVACADVVVKGTIRSVELEQPEASRKCPSTDRLSLRQTSSIGVLDSRFALISMPASRRASSGVII